MVASVTRGQRKDTRPPHAEVQWDSGTVGTQGQESLMSHGATTRLAS